MRKPHEQKLFERTVQSLPHLNNESLETLHRLITQLQSARRLGRSNALNSIVRADGERPNPFVPRLLEDE